MGKPFSQKKFNEDMKFCKEYKEQNVTFFINLIIGVIFSIFAISSLLSAKFLEFIILLIFGVSFIAGSIVLGKEIDEERANEIRKKYGPCQLEVKPDPFDPKGTISAPEGEEYPRYPIREDDMYIHMRHVSENYLARNYYHDHAKGWYFPKKDYDNWEGREKYELKEFQYKYMMSGRKFK